jgi:DnaJ-class molecular chaperone
MLRHEVIDALRNGRRLCANCYGKGFLVAHRCPDWLGDPEYDFKMVCEACKGEGLEPEARKPIRKE